MPPGVQTRKRSGRPSRRRQPVWRVLGSSVTGASHLAAGRGCDDAHAYRCLSDGTLLLAVADGAGSAPRSAEGALRATASALDSLQLSLEQRRVASAAAWRAVLAETLQQARAALESLAAGGERPRAASAESENSGPAATPEQAPLASFATTLLLAVVARGWVAAAQIGDGAIVVQDDGRGAEALTWPDHGQYANETSFLTGSAYLRQAQFVALRRKAPRGIFLFSDGMERLALAMRAREAYSPFFEDLTAFAGGPAASESELASFLASEAVCERTDDDKTLLIAVQV